MVNNIIKMVEKISPASLKRGKMSTITTNNSVTGTAHERIGAYALMAGL